MKARHILPLLMVAVAALHYETARRDPMQKSEYSSLRFIEARSYLPPFSCAEAHRSTRAAASRRIRLVPRPE